MKKKKIFLYTLTGCAAIILLLTLIHLVSALTLDRSIQYKEISYASPKIPQELDGYVIAFVTDTHEITAETLEDILRHVNNRKVDLLLLGGDYAKPDPGPTMAILGRAKTTDGIYGMDGNHDVWTNLQAAMQLHSMTLLNNTGQEIRPGFFLAGLAEARKSSGIQPDVQAALQNAASTDFVLLLVHNPDVSMWLDTTAVDVMLSGHTHGGQIAFFGLWAPALWLVTDYGHKFKGGWANAPDNTAVFVSKGAGQRQSGKILPFPRPRVFARPQIIFLTLKAL